MRIPDLGREGRLALALGTAGLGALSLIFGQLNPGLQPPLELLGGGQPVAYASGAFLFVAGLAFIPSILARIAGLAIAAFWLAWLVFGHTLSLIADSADVAAWVSLAEAAGLAAAAALSAAAHYRPAGPRATLGARLVVGLMLVWFGVVHLMYRAAIAKMIPDWVPMQALWPWFTGAANLAAGLAILTGLFGRPAAFLVGLMYASWVLLVHLPRLMADPDSLTEWTGLALNLCLIGVVWIVQGRGFPRGTGARTANP
jgi:uncharacterized membrane protein YphA (DoxX/SURF4 family)